MSGALIYSLWAQKHFCCHKCRRGPLAARTHPRGHTHWSGRTALSFSVSFPWMPWHSSGGMSTAYGGRSFLLQHFRSTPSLFSLFPKSSVTYLCVLGLVLLHNEVTEWMVLPHKENITTKAVPPAWRNDGNEARIQRKEGRKERSKPATLSWWHLHKSKFHCDLGESFECSLRT